MFNLLHSISNQELLEKHLCNPRIPKERNRAVRPNNIIVLKVKYPLRFAVGYVQPVTQQYESRTV